MIGLDKEEKVMFKKRSPVERQAQESPSVTSPLRRCLEAKVASVAGKEGLPGAREEWA